MDPKLLLEKYSEEFEKLCQKYLEYNSHTNISAIRMREEIFDKHFADSLEVASFLKGGRVLDLGSGGGFPILPLALVFKDVNRKFHFTALDSIAKKTKFIELMKEEFSLSNLEIITDRSENLARDENYRETYDFVLARAVANLSTLIEYAIPFLKVGGTLIAFKSDDLEGEEGSYENALEALSSEIIDRHKYASKQLIFIKKLANTDLKYPRKTGKPLKSPL